MIESPGLRLAQRVKMYTRECAEKAAEFRDKGYFSLSCHNLLNLLSVVVSGLQALVATIQGVYSVDGGIVAITSGCFSFANMVILRVISSYNFNVLSVLHNGLSDDYTELEQSFNLLLDEENIDTVLFNIYVKRYVSIVEKSHIQNVRSCGLTACC